MKRSFALATAAFIGLAGAAYSPDSANAQSPCSVLAYGVVPTVAQWQSCFEAKTDLGSNNGGGGNNGITGSEVIAALGYTPVNKTGDTMLGELIFNASTSSVASLNIPPGTAPTSPNNGDMWTTSGGIFVHVNGSTFSLGTGGGVTTISGDCNGTAVGAAINVTCGLLAHLGSTNNFTANNNQFTSTVINRRTLLTSGTLTLADNAVCVNSNGSALTATMPTGPINGMTISVDDCNRNSATHNITVAAQAGSTIGGGSSLTINTNGGAIAAVWNSTELDWNLY